MISLEVGSVVRCADCLEDSEIEFIGDYKGVTGYSLSCQHRNAYCKNCDLMARDCSDTCREIYMLCDNCIYDGPDEPPELPELLSAKNSKRKIKWQKPAPAYKLDDLRKVHKRSHFKWTEDEQITLSFYFDSKTPQELSDLFNRQASAIQYGRSKQPAEPIPENSAMLFLGTKIYCRSCNYETILSYLHLERLAEKCSGKVLDLAITEVIEKSHLFKCTECGEKNVKFNP